MSFSSDCPRCSEMEVGHHWGRRWSGKLGHQPLGSRFIQIARLWRFGRSHDGILRFWKVWMKFTKGIQCSRYWVVTCHETFGSTNNIMTHQLLKQAFLSRTHWSASYGSILSCPWIPSHWLRQSRAASDLCWDFSSLGHGLKVPFGETKIRQSVVALWVLLWERRETCQAIF